MNYIYFAHALVDYDTDYERECIELIKKHYPDSIIYNPNDKTINPRMPEIGRFIAYYIPRIKKCDILIATPACNHKRRKGELLSGTWKEIEFALKHNKEVFRIINNDLWRIKKDMK